MAVFADTVMNFRAENFLLNGITVTTSGTTVVNVLLLL
jgi:hypothetical protein